MDLKKIFIIIFSIIIIFALGIYGGYSLFKETNNNKINENNNKNNDNKESHTTINPNKIDNVIDNPIQDTVELTMHKDKTNEELYKFLYHLEEAYYRLDKTLVNYISNHNKILNDVEERLYFAYSYAITLDDVSIVKDINSNGEKEIGAYGVSKYDLIKIYKKLFNEDINRFYNLTEKDNMIYGKISNFHSDTGIILKANSFTRKGDIFTLNIDCLYLSIIDADYKDLLKYDTVDYDNDYIKYKLIMNLDRIDNNYIIKEIKVIKLK